MKKIAWVIAIAGLVGVFFAGTIFAEETGYKITEMKGKVLVKKAGSQDWVEAKVGDILSKSDSIKTLEDGSVYLETGPNTGFTMGPNTELVMDDTLSPPIAEPYSEPSGNAIENVQAPEVNQEGSASRI